MKKKTLITILIVLLFTSSCYGKDVRTADKEKTFFDIFPNIAFDGRIRLEEDPFSPNYKIIGSEVDLILVNLSDKSIEFNLSEDLNIYQYDEENNKWKKIENLINYHGRNQVLAPKGTPGISDVYAITWPNLIDNGISLQIRIVAVGTIIEEQSKNNRLGTYIDITLSPYD